MNKILKYGLIGTGAVVGIAVAGIAYVAVTFNPNDYKGKIIQAVKDSKQRNLRLDGDIKLSFFPSIGANLSRVSLSEFKSEKEFAAIDSARVSLALWPLLSKQVVVDEVAVSGLKATLVKHKDGTTNIDDLLGSQTEKPAKPVQTGSPGQTVKFDIASITIEKTNLGYLDEGSGAHYAIKDLNLKSGRIANGVPSKIALSLRVQANQPRLDINTQLKTTLTFDLDKQRYQLQGLDLQADGAVLDISDLKLKVGGDASANLGTQEFTAEKFTLNASGVKVKDHFDVALDAPALSLASDKYSSDKITLNAKLDGAPGNIAATLVLPNIQGNAQSFKIGALTLDLDVKQAEQTFNVKLSTPVSGNIKAQQINLSDLTLAVHATGDKLPGKSISSELKGNIQADMAKQNIQVNLAGGLLQSQIKARAAVNNFAVPEIRYDLEIDQFDADLYLPKKTADAKSKDKSKTAEPEQPFDLSALKTLNLEGSLRIGSLKAANIKVAQLRVDVKAHNGLVNIAPLTAKLYQGSIDGRASLNAGTSGFTINTKLDGVNIAPMMKDAADLELAEGRGNITLDLTTQGNTVGALKKALNGSASLNLADGAIKGINLSKLVQGVQSLGKSTTVQTMGVDKTEKTEFSELKASFKVRNGVAHNDDLAVKCTVLRVTGNGDIDIGHDSLNYNAKATFAKTAQGKTVTLPVNVSGAFDDLKFKVDYAALLADVARQQLDEKKEELKAKVKEDTKAKAQEELKKGLKGLFN